VTTRLVLLGDTHLPRFGRHLPAALEAALSDADVILHAGDITDAFVLDLLEKFAPTHAVAGNNDPPELAARLGFTRVVEVEAVRIGLTHGHLGSGRTTPERAVRAFAATDPPVDAVGFGHSHQPLIERRGDLWLLNPGSPTDRRRQPTYSCLRLDIHGRDLTPMPVEWPPEPRAAADRTSTGRE
jgi:putative phosphoesterase